MNKRIMEMIDLFSHRKNAVTLQDLADKFEVSTRTIRNDINRINEILEQEGLSDVYLGSNGVLEVNDNFLNIQEYVQNQDFYSYKLSREERKLAIAVFLINTVEYITLATIAEHLFVSRATIINDLDGVKTFLKEEGHLEVNSHPNKGLRVNGPESLKRRFLMQISDVSMKGIHGVNYTERLLGIKSGNEVTIRKIIQENEQLYECHLSDESFHRLELYLRIMIQRTDTDNYMEQQEHADNSKYRMAQDILKFITQYCNTHVTEDEVEYLSQFLEHCYYIKQTSTETDVVKTQLITRQLIEAISEDLEFNLNEDYEFYENLSNHLDSIFSKKNTRYPENPMLEEIVEENINVKEATKKHLNLLENYIGREITDIELTYIVIHVCAAIERKKNRDLSLHIILACSGGIGTSQLLLAKLKRHFNFRIVDIIAAHEVSTLEANEADLIITMVPLKDSAIPFVQVTPMLNDEDFIHVGSQIDIIRNTRKLPNQLVDTKLNASQLIEKLKPIIFEHAGEQADKCYLKVKNVIKESFGEKGATDDIFNPLLHQLLLPEYIEVDVECSDWKEAIRKTAEILLKKGYIEESYIEAMIHNVEENGPYIVISPNFALPHEGIGMGGLKLGMSFIKLKTPVAFGAEELDPVEFVCCLSPVDYSSHLKALFHLVNILQETDIKEELRKAKTEKEIANLFEKYEYSL